ncbi:hypothetical protein EXS71_04045 [Candidatus Uhrbacteria bacterium]|nr:hypothetical protein [Candidatus Uhrbacteria bacterium]
MMPSACRAPRYRLVILLAFFLISIAGGFSLHVERAHAGILDGMKDYVYTNAAIKQAVYNNSSILDILSSPFQVQSVLDKAQASCGIVNGKGPPEGIDQCVKNTMQSVTNQVAKQKVDDAAIPCSDVGITNGMTFFTCGVYIILTKVLGFIMQGLGMILQFLTDIFLGFAQYNGFSDAQAVQIGWKLIRDLVNMFFIVVLLISAFATIVGYGGEDFHYTHVLPKLLFMAILINFSKTLIQLLIDFSQVIMLTFVNAFQQVAAQNLLDSFGLTTITKFAEKPGAKATDYGNILLAYLLGIVATIIAIGTMIILIAFILGRIIGLWMALIFSPLALFATALPKKLQEKLGSLTKEYWGQLAGMLTGGPMVAFYLWLTFALLQGATAAGEKVGGSLGLYKPQGDAPQGFLTEFGQSETIAKFIIAISMLLLAIKQATSAASSIGSSTISGFAKSIEGKTLGAARFVAASPFLAGRGAARGVKAGAGAGARAIERRADFRGKFAKAAQATVGRIPLVKGLVRAPLAGLVGANREQRNKEAEEMLKPTKGMTHGEKLQYLNSISDGRTASSAERQARAAIYADVGSEASQLSETKRRSAEIDKALEATMPGSANAAARKRIADVQAQTETSKAAAGNLAKSKALYGQLGDDKIAKEKLKEINDMIEKNPHLEADEGKRADLLSKLALDPDKQKNLSAGAISRGSVLANLLPPGAVKRDADGNITGFDQAEVDRFMATNPNKQLKENMEAFIGHAKKNISKTGKMQKGDIDDMLIQKGTHGEPRLYKGSDGKVMLDALQKDAQDDFNLELVNDAGKGRNLAGDLRTDAADAVMAQLSSGASLSQVLTEGRREVAGPGGAMVSDEAIEKHLADKLSSSMASADLATNKAQLDTALKDFMTISSQIDGGGVSSETQMKIIAAVRNSGGGAPTIAGQWNDMDRNQRKAFEKVVKVAAARADDAGKKAVASRTADENSAIEFMKELKFEMPRRAERNAAGTVTKEQAPPALHPYLHGT